ncbi:MAG: hypothetical protein ACOWWR_18600 [Eubacteriales bacterium]
MTKDIKIDKTCGIIRGRYKSAHFKITILNNDYYIELTKTALLKSAKSLSKKNNYELLKALKPIIEDLCSGEIDRDNEDNLYYFN